MAIRQFAYPLKGNVDSASIRTKEIALEAFLNSLSLSDDPDDPSHNHDSEYADVAHTHPPSDHTHDYVFATEGTTAPGSPDVGDIWIENVAGDIVDIFIYTAGQGWQSVLGGEGGGTGAHSRHPDDITLYQSSDNEDKWLIALNPAYNSLDFSFVG